MSHWHERKPNLGSWVFPARKGGRVAAKFTGEDVRVAPFPGHFLRYEGPEPVPTGAFPHWTRRPEGWFELWPREPLLASSMDEARERIDPLLPGLEDGSADDRYAKRPYVPPVRPTRVEEIEHATHHARAVIVQWPEGHYEVGYIVYAPNGRYFPAATPSISTELDWEWGVTSMADDEGRELRTLASNRESAREIAARELDLLVRQDPCIKLRSPTATGS